MTATALRQRDGKVTATAAMVGATAPRQRRRNGDATTSKDNACVGKAVSIGARAPAHPKHRGLRTTTAKATRWQRNNDGTATAAMVGAAATL